MLFTLINGDDIGHLFFLNMLLILSIPNLKFISNTPRFPSVFGHSLSGFCAIFSIHFGESIVLFTGECYYSVVAGNSMTSAFIREGECSLGEGVFCMNFAVPK